MSNPREWKVPLNALIINNEPMTPSSELIHVREVTPAAEPSKRDLSLDQKAAKSNTAKNDSEVDHGEPSEIVPLDETEGAKIARKAAGVIEAWNVGDTFVGRGGGQYVWTVLQVFPDYVWAQLGDEERRFFFDQIERRVLQ